LCATGVRCLLCSRRPPSWAVLSMGYEGLYSGSATAPWVDIWRLRLLETTDAMTPPWNTLWFDRPASWNTVRGAPLALAEEAAPASPVRLSADVIAWDLEVVNVDGIRGAWIAEDATLANFIEALNEAGLPGDRWRYTWQGRHVEPTTRLVDFIGIPLRAAVRRDGGARGGLDDPEGEAFEEDDADLGHTAPARPVEDEGDQERAASLASRGSRGGRARGRGGRRGGAKAAGRSGAKATGSRSRRAADAFLEEQAYRLPGEPRGANVASSSTEAPEIASTTRALHHQPLHVLAEDDVPENPNGDEGDGDTLADIDMEIEGMPMDTRLTQYVSRRRDLPGATGSAERFSKMLARCREEAASGLANIEREPVDTKREHRRPRRAAVADCGGDPSRLLAETAASRRSNYHRRSHSLHRRLRPGAHPDGLHPGRRRPLAGARQQRLLL